MKYNYDDIINLPHHVSKKHPQMSMQNRAAQFAPFSALTGHESAIRETARQTSSLIEYDNDHAEILDRKIRIMLDKQDIHTSMSITYFKPDKTKNGGCYKTINSTIKEIDKVNNVIILTNGEQIPFTHIYDIDINTSNMYK